VVLKPAEFTPLSASLWAGIFAEAELPTGCSTWSTASARRRATPWSSTGRAAHLVHGGVPHRAGDLRNCAEHLKAMSMELGGKSPAVVFADADLAAAIDSTLFGVFSLNGERCTAGSRILVERPVYDEFVRRFAERAGRIVVGDPSDEKTEVGALVHPEHFAKVMSYVEIGKAEGRLVAGGGRPDGLAEGNYVAPTVFADVPPDARIFREEIFGPVVAITPFDGDAEALKLANDTPYGLAAYIWTNDLTRAHTFAQSGRGRDGVAEQPQRAGPRSPFGGVKASGLGHEGGYRSLDFYSDQQAVHITLGDVHTTRFGAR
jgi:5-carboxymethyl-2-hydroxymuconic-semialdehyde dehydrogenase